MVMQMPRDLKRIKLTLEIISEDGTKTTMATEEMHVANDLRFEGVGEGMGEKSVLDVKVHTEEMEDELNRIAIRVQPGHHWIQVKLFARWPKDQVSNYTVKVEDPDEERES